MLERNRAVVTRIHSDRPHRDHRTPGHFLEPTPNVDDYPLFAKRPPLDQGYLKSFNRDKVHLVDIKDKEPLVEITENGILTTRNEYELDIIVLATGFNAYTGTLEALPIFVTTGNARPECSLIGPLGFC